MRAHGGIAPARGTLMIMKSKVRYIVSCGLFAAWLASGCDGERRAPGGSNPVASAPAASSAASSAPQSSVPDAVASMSKDVADFRARELLDAWRRAQNERKIDDYAKLYASDFSGIRRTPSGEEKRTDRADWID